MGKFSMRVAKPELPGSLVAVERAFTFFDNISSKRGVVERGRGP